MILTGSLQVSSPCLVPSMVLAALQKWPHLVITAQKVALLPHGTEGEAETSKRLDDFSPNYTSAKGGGAGI